MLKKNPATTGGDDLLDENYEVGDRLVAFGYSRGGDTALEFAQQLGEYGVHVDLAATVDSAYGPLFVSRGSPVEREVPANVAVNINLYQTEPSRIPSRGDENASSSDDTRVYIREV